MSKYRANGLRVTAIPSDLLAACNNHPELVLEAPPLTPRQLAVLRAVVQLQDEQGRFPRVKSLVDVLGIGPSTVYQHLARLAGRGCLGRSSDGQSWVIRYLPPPLPTVALPPQPASRSFTRGKVDDRR